MAEYIRLSFYMVKNKCNVLAHLLSQQPPTSESISNRRMFSVFIYISIFKSAVLKGHSTNFRHKDLFTGDVGIYQAGGV